jgi:hypothetical protein
VTAEPVRLGDALSDLGTPGGARPADTARLWRAWPVLAGATVCAHVEPTSLRDGVLRLRADSPVWATEVGYLADHIRARANEILEGPVVREVRVWTGPGPVLEATVEGPLKPQSNHMSSKAREPDPQGALRSAYEAWKRSRTGISTTSERPSREGNRSPG